MINNGFGLKNVKKKKADILKCVILSKMERYSGNCHMTGKKPENKAEQYGFFQLIQII